MSTTNEADADVPPTHWPSQTEASSWDKTRASSHDQDNTTTTSSSSSPHRGNNHNNPRRSSINLQSGNGRRSSSSSSREPVSLAVAADVSQAPIPDNASSENHARGGAVAHHLQSLLSHISSHNDHITPLKTETNQPANAMAKDDVTLANDSTTRGSTNNNENAAQTDQTSGGGEKMAEPPPQKEFSFKKMMHSIDNYLHPPSKLFSTMHLAPPRQHHHQGHRISSSNSAVDPSCHNPCDSGCLQICAKQQQQQQHGNGNGNGNAEHYQIQQQSNGKSKSPTNSSPRRRNHLLSSISTSVATFTSNLQSHSNHTDSGQPASTDKPKQQSSRSFFSFSFHSATSQSPMKRSSPRHRGPLLYNCSDHDMHEAMVTTALHVSELYRMGQDVTRTKYHQNGGDLDTCIDGDETENDGMTKRDAGGEVGDRGEHERSKPHRDFDHRARHALSSVGFEFRLDQAEDEKIEGKSDSSTLPDRVTRLYHVPSDTAVTDKNRKTFIADGKMYDAVADLCQAAAQEIMAERCDLVWVTICDGKGGGLRAQYQVTRQDSQSKLRSSISIEEWPRDANGNIIVKEPIRALVGRQLGSGTDTNNDHEPHHDTFLVVTGKGKVRAGIFSRQHLMTTGLEPSTALPLLCEARDRGMNCVVIDPNARGDRYGMDTFEESIRGLFELQSSDHREEEEEEEGINGTNCKPDAKAIIPASVDGSIYVLAHSAAGGQLVRYLLDQQKDAPLLSRIRCITFTDSTHSIQWLKRHPHISSLIQSSKALYIRSANPMRDDDWENASPGDECPKDHFWSHRFGEIKTVWAGTTEHSLSNWTAHKPIWDHFDSIRDQFGGASTSSKNIATNGATDDTSHDLKDEEASSRGTSDLIEKTTNFDGTSDYSHQRIPACAKISSSPHPHHTIGMKPVVI